MVGGRRDGDAARPRVVVITGASAGIGRATARELARQRAHVALLARGIDGLAATGREVDALGGRALLAPLDVAEAAEVEMTAQRIEEELGPIDVWINCASVSVVSPIRDMTAD